MEITTFLTGIAMGESARWHDGRFWMSDWVAGEILAADPDGTTEVVAKLTDGLGSNEQPSFAPNGRHVVFGSSASNLVAGDTNGHWDIFVRDLDRSRTVRVSVATVRDARIGKTWTDHPTPPDMAPRTGGGRICGREAKRRDGSA